jgi:hypothetical protein
MPIPDWNAIEPILQWLGIASLATFLISLAIIPLLISRMPADYFVRPHPFRHPFAADKGLLYPCWFIFRNAVGILVLIAGFTMLFLPGQGILTIILGVALMSFPGKHRLLFSMTAKPSVQRSLDWIRTRTGRPQFAWPATADRRRSPRP